jgi:hypothetical protein
MIKENDESAKPKDGEGAAYRKELEYDDDGPEVQDEDSEDAL